MKKYLMHCLKSTFPIGCIIGATFFIPYAVSLLFSDTPVFWVLTLDLTLLCYISPLIYHSFRFNKSAVDLYYSLPLTREKLYLVDVLRGLFLIFVSFSILFWGGFLILLFKATSFHLIWYLPAYFGCLLFAVLLYGFNAFLLTRANNEVDAGIFIFFSILLSILLSEGIGIVGERLFEGWEWFASDLYTLFSPWNGIADFLCIIEKLVLNGKRYTSWSPLSFVFAGVMGIASYVLLFLLAARDKAENAGGISESAFGYPFFIPAILFLALVLDSSWIAVLLMATLAFVITFVYRRTIRFRLVDWLRIGIPILCGSLVNLITQSI